MPWKELSVVEARARLVFAYRDKVESFGMLCARFGISRNTGYKWLRRYRAGGVRALGDASRRPHYCAKAYRNLWHERLSRARKGRPQWGPKKLRIVLKKRFRRAERIPAVSTLGLWLAQSHLTRSRKRRARPGPRLPCRGPRVARHCNDVWTVDFKGWFCTGDNRRCEPLTVRDLYSRYMLAVVLLPNQSDAAVRQAFGTIFRRYGLPRALRVDNGAPFSGSGALGLSRLSVWWLRLGIEVDFIRRGHPQDNGAHEQMHRILKAETATPAARTLRAQKARMTRWISRYNKERPHETLGQQVPAHFYRPSNRAMPAPLPAAKYPRSWMLRRVRNRGHIKWEGRCRFVGRAFVGELVGLKPRADGSHDVYLQQQLIGLLYSHDLAGMRPASIAYDSLMLARPLSPKA